MPLLQILGIVWCLQTAAMFAVIGFVLLARWNVERRAARQRRFVRLVHTDRKPI